MQKYVNTSELKEAAMSVKIKIMGNPSINVDGERLNLPLKKLRSHNILFGA